MEMAIEIIIERITTKVTLANGRDDNILAFAEIYIYEPREAEPVIKVKGITIKKKEFGEKQVIAVVFPGYRAGRTWQTSFVFPNKNLWSDVSELLLNDYYSQGGEHIIAEAEINIDEVAEGIKKMKRES